MAADESFAAHCEGYGLEWIDKSSSVTAPDPRLDEIQARLNAASKGPWQAGVAATSDGSEVCATYEQKKAFLALSLNDGDRPLWIVDNSEVIPAATGDGPNAGYNAEFIAHAPTDIAYLLAELRKAHEALEWVEALADKWERLAGPGSEAERIYKAQQKVSVGFAVKSIRAAVAAAKEAE